MATRHLTAKIDDLVTKDESGEFPGGTVQGLASTFGNVDLQGEVIVAGAFAESIQRFNRGELTIPLMDNHKPVWYGGVGHRQSHRTEGDGRRFVFQGVLQYRSGSPRDQNTDKGGRA